MLAEATLRHGVALIGRKLVVTNRFGRILGQPDAVVVKEAKVKLTVLVSLGGCKLHQASRRGFIFADAFAALIHQAENPLRARIATLGRELVIAQRLLWILRQA